MAKFLYRAEIEWLDSRQPSSGWQFAEGFEPESVVRVRTLGFVLQENEEAVVVAQNAAYDGFRQPVTQISGVMTIPRCCVLEIKKIMVTENAQ
jgi:hypothetical protein